jgi:ABC-2 type transport system permease protein
MRAAKCCPLFCYAAMPGLITFVPMKNKVSQVKAAFTISKYSLLATLKSPTSVVFSLLFPIIFIVVFGAMVGDKLPAMKVVIAPGSNTTGPVYKAIGQVPLITLQQPAGAAEMKQDLKTGRISAIMSIEALNANTAMPHYLVHLKTSAASAANARLLRTLVNEALDQLNGKAFPDNPAIATLSAEELPGRAYHSIDFILPGQLGFSLLMAGVYGSSYLLFSLRQNLVLRRLRVAPLRRRSIIAGEMLSRLFFHIISFIIMVLLGYYAFQFTLVNGFDTFIEMLLFSLLGLFIFMGIGFIISGLVQNENSISPIANTVVLPQILLCGLFFPVGNYPLWLQHFCNLLPLTFFVDGLRKIAFDGKHIWELGRELSGLVIWTLLILPLSIRSFRWE